MARRDNLEVFPRAKQGDLPDLMHALEGGGDGEAEQEEEEEKETAQQNGQEVGEEEPKENGHTVKDEEGSADNVSEEQKGLDDTLDSAPSRTDLDVEMEAPMVEPTEQTSQGNENEQGTTAAPVVNDPGSDTGTSPTPAPDGDVDMTG